MFNGTIPAELRSFEHEHAKQWKVSETWSACSGNLTTEHVLREAGVTVLHSNDVTLYSCMVGGYFAGTPLRTSSGPPNRSPGDSCFPGKRGVGGSWRMRVLVLATARNGAPGPRFRSTMERGARMCLSSDAMNVVPWAPFQNLCYMTTGDTLLPVVPGVPADQQLTREEALRYATVDCAWFIGQDRTIGSLEPGKQADLIVLSDDYFRVPDNAVKDIRSRLTIVDGRIVSADGEFSHLAR